MENMNYDSSIDTLKHIKMVNQFLIDFSIDLLKRAQVHDNSKLVSPEKEFFDEMTPILEKVEYGSSEYKESLEKLKPALDNHYAINSHHPQHYHNGIDDMTLHDIVEMYCDWRGAVLRTKNGDMNRSIDINAERFNMSPQLAQIFKNTLKFE
jgi:hypothetical protein